MLVRMCIEQAGNTVCDSMCIEQAVAFFLTRTCTVLLKSYKLLVLLKCGLKGEGHAKINNYFFA